MKVWRELTLDFFFFRGVFFAFRGVCYLDKGVFFDLGGVSILDLLRKLSDVFN